jgi:hypothetical protein
MTINLLFLRFLIVRIFPKAVVYKKRLTLVEILASIYFSMEKTNGMERATLKMEDPPPPPKPSFLSSQYKAHP